MVIQDWSMINASPSRPNSNWRVGADACLIRRDLLLQVGGLDAAYASREAVGLDLGYRCLHAGALVEHRPELSTKDIKNVRSKVPSQDLYLFLLRHYGARWAQYVALRRGITRFTPLSEKRALDSASRLFDSVPAPALQGPVWYEASESQTWREADVSVIIPTLGRYPYLPEALESLRRQSVRPREVIVVDQNPPESRQPEVYEGYEDLCLRVIWQDERGQSLARNTGLAAVKSRYVFLFDDDSIAYDNLLEAHLRIVLGGRFQVSTGVALPPPPSDYKLPEAHLFPRVAQTLDTGNSLLSLELARETGGLDRNYDLGPGTDLDFGTRLYLKGVRIAHNPDAVRIHFKAPMGGLRVHGSHKYNSDGGLLQPFPPPTQSYYGIRFLDRRQRSERLLISFATSKFTSDFRRGQGGLKQKIKALGAFGLSCALLPVKVQRSRRQARNLLNQGIRVHHFENGSVELPETERNDRANP
jgi:glycosyltransferase involved in cell wall biosynthesis